MSHATLNIIEIVLLVICLACSGAALILLYTRGNPITPADIADCTQRLDAAVAHQKAITLAYDRFEKAVALMVEHYGADAVSVYLQTPERLK